MISLLSDLGGNVFFNLVQIAAGSIIAIMLFGFCKERLNKIPGNLLSEAIVIVALTLAGMLLPMGTFGIIPIVSALIVLGIKPALVIPLIVSNAFFNMLIPYSDTSFVWRTGLKRVVLAFVVGMLAGLLLRKLKGGNPGILRSKIISSIGARPLKPSDIALIPARNINIAGPCLIIGALLGTLFQRYGFPSLIHFVFTNPTTSAVPNFFSTQSVTNPLFILTIKISEMLMDLTRLSALVLLFKPKGVILYYAYYIAIALFMALSLFIYKV